jgi:bifunctional DNase/RNase
MPVQVELHQIIIREMEHEQFIVLKEVDGERRLPILIGSAEAFAIDRRLKGIPAARPLTHDLLASVIESLGGVLERIEITNLEYIAGQGTGTFVANIHIRQDGKVIKVDSRPSDAIALGAAGNVPIFVAEDVMNTASD